MKHDITAQIEHAVRSTYEQLNAELPSPEGLAVTVNTIVLLFHQPTDDTPLKRVTRETVMSMASMLTASSLVAYHAMLGNETSLEVIQTARDRLSRQFPPDTGKH